MSPFRSILIAADLSKSSRNAFRIACSLASRDQGRISVLHVLKPNYKAEEPVYQGQPSVHFSAVSRIRKDYQNDLDQLRRFYAPSQSLNIDYLAREGSPEETILKEAEATGCDLIAMGTHGRSGLNRLLMGSVAETVLRQASCSVLAIRETRTPTETESGDEDFILHPTDFSANSEAALRTARTLAQDRGSRLVLMHASPLEIVSEGMIPAPWMVQEAQAALEALAKRIDGPDLKHPVSVRFARGTADVEILQAARDEPGVGLIVMGTHGRSGLHRFLMGSVAESVLRNADGPVLIVKPTQIELIASSEASPLKQAPA